MLAAIRLSCRVVLYRVVPWEYIHFDFFVCLKLDSW
jgi:hypothetical protein